MFRVAKLKCQAAGKKECALFPKETPYFHRTRNLRGSRQDARPHFTAARRRQAGSPFIENTRPEIKEISNMRAAPQYDALVESSVPQDLEQIVDRREISILCSGRRAFKIGENESPQQPEG